MIVSAETALGRQTATARRLVEASISANRDRPCSRTLGSASSNLDRRGRILAANDRARSILRQLDGASARGRKACRLPRRVAVWLADGKSVRDMATATDLTEGTSYWHLKRIYQKLPSRQVDLVRLVLSIAEFG